MLRVGLTGGYATGKSFVAAELARLGCHVIYADRLGHEVLRRGRPAFEPAVALLGPAVLGDDLEIDRKRVAALVFHQPELLRQLSAIVHPAVFALEQQQLSEFAQGSPQGIAVIEAAILIETGRAALFDRVILTDCSEEIQISRGIKRDHLTPEQVLQRIRSQMPSVEKKRFAHFVIDTSGPKEATRQQVEQVYRQLSALAKQSPI